MAATLELALLALTGRSAINSGLQRTRQQRRGVLVDFQFAEAAHLATGSPRTGPANYHHRPTWPSRKSGPQQHSDHTFDAEVVADERNGDPHAAKSFARMIAVPPR